MGQDKILRPTVWRDPPRKAAATAHEHEERAPADNRVLLLVEGEGNRRKLAEQIGRQHAIVEPANGALPHDGFDLAIVDGPGFRRWHSMLADAKTREQPVFLPVMLVLPRQDLRRRAGAYWDLIDEFIVAPIERTEFLERVTLLLRTRQMAREQQADLAHIVNHDSATGLPTQALFIDRVQNTIHNASILGQHFHVVVIHVPMAHVMKSLGHDAVDRATQACATRLRRLVGDDLSLARLTTEHWGLLGRPGMSVDEVTHVCRQLGALSEHPIEAGHERVYLSAYVGVSTYPDDATSATDALNAAFGALSRANEAGEPYFYSRDVQIQALRYLRTETRLHEALEQRQFELWLQPQFRLGDHAFIGAEGLVRWRLPSGDLVPPADFIPVAEASGLIQQIDRWVLEAACEIVARWHKSPATSGLRLAVNITPQDLAEPGFVPWVKELFERYRVLPDSLELELTETMFCDTDQAILDKLNDLREYGVTVAIDDFGTGYSSLGYLHKLPINILKIDKSFTDRVPGDTTSEGITEAIIGLAHHFNLEIVAEGIETQEQIDYLHGHGVQTGQGFLMGRPMPEPEFLAHIGRGGRRA